MDQDLKSIERWDDFPGIGMPLLRGIYNNGFEKPSQIQKTAILPIMEGRDIIAQAPSGTGKTGAFTVGTLHRIDASIPKTQAIILAPTHELAKQITAVAKNIGNSIDKLEIKTLVGGTSTQEDVRYFRYNTPHLVVGSIGRILDMIGRKCIRVADVKILVVDEADEMLSSGFKDQIYHIFQALNMDIQVALFSATMPPEMLQITEKFMRDPVKIVMETEQLNLEGIQQYYVAVPNDDIKYDVVKDLFGNFSVNQCIIYVNSVRRVMNLYNAMTHDGFSVCSIHSSMRMEERDRAFRDFRTGVFRVLISSNVTARGIDIQQVSTVINFDVPKCPHTYLHRIGRSGRWGRKGLAINLITREDIGKMKFIEGFYKSNIQELPSSFPSV